MEKNLKDTDIKQWKNENSLPLSAEDTISSTCSGLHRSCTDH
jgi:hypothetical protein